MTDCKHEKISALVDGEDIAGRAEVMDHLLKDEALRARWARYHLIADCLRGHLSHTVSDISASINHRLRDEPAILAPAQKQPFGFKPLAGLAIAASVVVCALLAVPVGERAEPARPAAVAATASPPASDPARSVTFEAPPVLPAGAGRVASVADQRMKNYLVNHSEFRRNGRINGIPPYARVVTFEARE